VRGGQTAAHHEHVGRRDGAVGEVEQRRRSPRRDTPGAAQAGLAQLHHRLASCGEVRRGALGVVEQQDVRRAAEFRSGLLRSRGQLLGREAVALREEAEFRRDGQAPDDAGVDLGEHRVRLEVRVVERRIDVGDAAVDSSVQQVFVGTSPV